MAPGRRSTGRLPAALGMLRALRQACFESEELREHIAARGGTLCVSLQAIMRR